MKNLIKQLVVIENNPFTQEQGEKAFRNWISKTRDSEEKGVATLFELPPMAAVAILKLHL